MIWILPYVEDRERDIKYFLKGFTYLFLERQEGSEKGRETLMYEKYLDRLPLTHPQLGTWPATQACDRTGNRTGNHLVHRPELNLLSHTS